MHTLLDLFCNAIGMEVNIEKSFSYIHKIKLDCLLELKALFQFKVEKMEIGFKYLVFFLKPNNYRVKDWFWIIKKIEKRISNWNFRFLSLGGMPTLIKATLQRIPIYWCSLVKILASIINSIRNIIFTFYGQARVQRENFIWLLGKLWLLQLIREDGV